MGVQGMSLAAEDHLHDLGQRGTVSHQGADGSTASERLCRYGAWSGKCGGCLWYGRIGTSAKHIIEDLIVDDGVPTRGHRLGIYYPAYRVAGVRMGPHKTFGACCVIEFAANYEDNEARLISRATAGPPAVVAGKEPVKTQWKDLGQCPGCKQTIRGGSVIEALGQKWHVDCFVCQAEGCKKNLRGVPYQEHAGKTFCKDCYYEQFGSICAGCGERIKGGEFKAMGQTWHKECFVCSSCHGPLEARFATRDGKPLCSGCSRGSGKAAAPPLVAAAQRNASAAKAGGARSPPPKTPPKSGALVKAGSLAMQPKAKIGACRTAAPKIAVGSAKKVVDSLVMDYADLA